MRSDRVTEWVRRVVALVFGGVFGWLTALAIISLLASCSNPWVPKPVHPTCLGADSVSMTRDSTGACVRAKEGR